MSAHPLDSPTTPLMAWSCALHCGASDLAWFSWLGARQQSSREGSARDPP